MNSALLGAFLSIIFFRTYIFIIPLTHLASIYGIDSKASRVIYFTSISEGILLDFEAFKIFPSPKSRSHCAMLCLIEPRCKSFSFCRDISCLLYSNDSYTLGNFVLIPKSKCFYVEMAQSEHPLCEIRGDYVNITSDEGHKSELCSINSKRADGVWAEWDTEVLVDNSDLFKTERKRECLYFSHGGINCTGIMEEVIVFPLKQRTRGYESAKHYCNFNFPGY